MCRSARALGALLMMVVATSSSALGSLTPAAIMNSPGVTYPGGQYTLGFSFTLNQNLTVTALGVFDESQDGLTNRAEVGIWDNAGNLLASTFVPAGTSGTLVGFYRYASIAPLNLTTGVTYVVGAYATDLASSYNTGQGGSGTYDSAVNPIEDRFSNFNSIFSFPDTSNNFAAGNWAGGNFAWEGTPPPAVPEPATVVSAGLAGLLGLAYAARRRRRAA